MEFKRHVSSRVNENWTFSAASQVVPHQQQAACDGGEKQSHHPICVCFKPACVEYASNKHHEIQQQDFYLVQWEHHSFYQIA